MILEPGANTYGTNCFCFLLMRRVTNLAKYPAKTGLRGFLSVITNLNRRSNKIIDSLSFCFFMVLSSSSGSNKAD